MIEKKLNGQSEYTLEWAEGDYSVNSEISREGGIDVIRITFASKTPVTPPVIKLSWDIPSVDIQGTWHPTGHIDRGVPGVWGGGHRSSAASGSPMFSLYSSSGENRMTFACSDAMNPLNYYFALREEDSRWLCYAKLFDTPTAECDSYECTMRVDYRNVRWDDAIGDVVRFWADMPMYSPMPAVDECRHPVYSTWYSFHQYAYGDEIEEVLETAAPLGFKAVIVDDGWQMEDSQRSYAYCGDWEVSPAKIKDMKAHVARVHAMGLKYYLWYSVPFVGVHSRAYETFKGKYFGSGDTVVLDPRYPDVREYLISKYENAVKDWDLDGFKLDFIDSFRQPENEAADAAPGRDYVSVPQAVDRLMTDIKKRLQALKPNIAIEFRQSYVGPLMRKYGNMFRAADCANDTVINKIRTMDTRLCVGTSTVHSDMITWSREDTAEAACLQFIATMFAVPQISVRPATLPEEHRLMMQNWIAFWESHRDTLLDGKLRLYSPELLYPIATAESEAAYIAGIYASGTVVPAPSGDPAKIVIVNGSGYAGAVVRLPEGKYSIEIKDCLGNAVASHDCAGGLCEIADLPVAGIAYIHRA